jgi:oligosaccharide 4-alpha-D-glucosyltransferase
VRWLQFAAFTPIFRPHGTALYEKDPNAFSFPSEAALIDKPYKALAKKAIELRYLLLPYNYSLAYQQTKYGKPLMAPLYYYYPTDTSAVNIQVEYMWGENILVAPILDKGEKQRRIYLPEGKWIYNDTIIKGNKWITMPVVLDYIPIFTREGSFVPVMIKDEEDSITHDGKISKKYKKSFGLVYFPSYNKTSFEWYNDDGNSKNSIAAKKYTLVQCKGEETEARVTLSIAPSNKLFVENNLMVSVVGLSERPKAVFVNNKKIDFWDLDIWHVVDEGSNKAVWKKNEKSISIYTRYGNAKNLVIDIIK